MTTPLIDRLAQTVRDTGRPVSDEDRTDLEAFLPLAHRYAHTARVTFDEERSLALAVHALALVRRVRTGERLDALDDHLAAEVAPGRMTALRSLLDDYCTPRGFTPPDAEVLLLALHFEAAAQQQQHPARQT